MPIKKNTLHKIRNEYFHQLRISADVYVDAMTTKKIFENMNFFKNETLNGFIQEVNMDPFGILFFSHLQVIKVLSYFKENF